MSFLNNLWYGKTISSFFCQFPLLPLSWIFGVLAAARRSMYSNGLCTKEGPVVPVVVVGGITVGGTGKTPLCIALVNELKARGYNPGVLSRGYKSHCKNHPCQVPLDGSPRTYGDEPCLIRRETLVPVVIDPKRVRGADYLVSLGVDVIVTDDGLQHYPLDRDIEICVLDGARMLGNEHLLPAGPLREAKWRLKTVDSVVVTGAVAHLGYFPMMLRPSGVYAIDPESQEVIESKSKVCAVAGIGNPARFYKSLEDYGFTLGQVVHLGDHEKMPLDKLKKLASQMPVIMTSKDAIKYQKQAKELTNVFVFNVQASLSKQFFDDIANKIKQSKYRVSQRKQKREAQGYKIEPVEPIDQELILSMLASKKALANVHQAIERTVINDPVAAAALRDEKHGQDIASRLVKSANATQSGNSVESANSVQSTDSAQANNVANSAQSTLSSVDSVKDAENATPINLLKSSASAEVLAEIKENVISKYSRQSKFNSAVEGADSALEYEHHTHESEHTHKLDHTEGSGNSGSLHPSEGLEHKAESSVAYWKNHSSSVSNTDRYTQERIVESRVGGDLGGGSTLKSGVTNTSNQELHSENRSVRKKLSELQGLTTAQGNSWFASGSESLDEDQPHTESATVSAASFGVSGSKSTVSSRLNDKDMEASLTKSGMPAAFEQGTKAHAELVSEVKAKVNAEKSGQPDGVDAATSSRNSKNKGKSLDKSLNKSLRKSKGGSKDGSLVQSAEQVLEQNADNAEIVDSAEHFKQTKHTKDAEHALVGSKSTPQMNLATTLVVKSDSVFDRGVSASTQDNQDEQIAQNLDSIKSRETHSLSKEQAAQGTEPKSLDSKQEQKQASALQDAQGSAQGYALGVGAATMAQNEDSTFKNLANSKTLAASKTQVNRAKSASTYVDSSREDKPIFAGLQPQHSHFDPNALPPVLKRKTPKTTDKS